MKKEDLRKAKLTQHADSSGDYSINVLFHKFIEETEYDTNGNFQHYNYALVEHENGKVEAINPSLVKFID